MQPCQTKQPIKISAQKGSDHSGAYSFLGDLPNSLHRSYQGISPMVLSAHVLRGVGQFACSITACRAYLLMGICHFVLNKFRLSY